MAMEHFQAYLKTYGEEYYEKYVHSLNDIGDYLCGIDDDGLWRWIRDTDLNPRPFQKNSIADRGDEGSVLPPYAQALQWFFYKHYEYPDQRCLASERNRVTELEIQLAAMAHAGRSTVASWKSGRRVPDKYKWWALGIGLFELNFWDVQPYLDMIGCQVDMTCLDDILLFYSVCSGKTVHEVFRLLSSYSCTHSMRCFDRPAEAAEGR